ncbi:MAG TPA: CsbD family protein [Solimonas sp.]|nr:CsbD family protein [Solimonas sp.]
MNSDMVKGQIRQLAGRSREAWGQLTGDSAGRAAGNLQRLVGEAQVSYGHARQSAARKLRSARAHPLGARLEFRSP